MVLYDCLLILKISIHPPRVGRDTVNMELFINELISIHPPRVGRDGKQAVEAYASYISIHPPRVGRDRPGTGHAAI